MEPEDNVGLFCLEFFRYFHKNPMQLLTNGLRIGKLQFLKTLGSVTWTFICMFV